ncbi:dihydrofolate reductase [Alkalicoccus chagannorensis]|uniref:dihydrofolate reductase n=1 Tax=Alkalicoccus chagannorensis TaxID=427072 RepID=UPI000422DFE9|nr:dihydrofolate reductase [Alkalicoccus chagannorensis]
MITMIAAMDENNVIGRDGTMPWHLPADLRFFKERTMDKKIVMGRKTFDSIGRALPGRHHMVLTNNRNWSHENVTVLHEAEEVRREAEEEEVVICGGAVLYEKFLPYADRLYITRIHDTFKGDTFFPEWDEAGWHVVESREGPVDEKNVHPHTYMILERKVDV